MRTVSVKWPLLWTIVAMGAWGLAQPLSGRFVGDTGVGHVVVELSVAGRHLVGRLETPAAAFGLDGDVVDGVGFGFVAIGEGRGGFEAYVRGDTLGLYVYEFDAAGTPDPATVVELILTRAAPPAAAPSAAGPTAPGPIAAPPKAAAGGFAKPGTTAPDASPIVAAGGHASLTRDAALAFVEALEFVLTQAGYGRAFSDAERAEAVAAVAANFPRASRVDQLVLADARRTWDGVQANWWRASADEQRAFALGVLILAFGEETVAAWVGPDREDATGPPAEPSGGCDSFEACAGRFVDERTWTDTFHAQGCWAAAGCSSFDSGTGTFTYDD